MPFRCSEIPFLGHVISAEGIRPDPKNVTIIAEAPVLTTLKQTHSFLSTVSFYSPFIPHLADEAEPLRAMTRGEKPLFAWTSECQEAFGQLMSCITEHLQLAIFDPQCETNVNCDGLDVVLGATLTQIQHGKEVTISCPLIHSH